MAKLNITNNIRRLRFENDEMTQKELEAEEHRWDKAGTTGVWAVAGWFAAAGLFASNGDYGLAKISAVAAILLVLLTLYCTRRAYEAGAQATYLKESYKDVY